MSATKTMRSVMLCLLLLAGTLAWSQAPPPLEQNACMVCRLELRVGTNRAEVEQMVAALLKTKMAYSPYGNNLRGGIVEYEDGDWLLRVSYKAGAPAPWVAGSNGAQHMAPIDETVLSYAVARRGE